jgi:hypothetical protein
MFGDAIDLPEALRDVSPFTHTPQAPLEPVTVAPLVAITGIVAVLLTDATGLAAAGREAELAKVRNRVFDLVASNAAVAPLQMGDAINELMKKLKAKAPVKPPPKR